MNPLLSIFGQCLHLLPDLQDGGSVITTSGPGGNFAFITESFRFLGLLLPKMICAVVKGLVLELLPRIGQKSSNNSLIGGFDGLYSVMKYRTIGSVPLASLLTIGLSKDSQNRPKKFQQLPYWGI